MDPYLNTLLNRPPSFKTAPLGYSTSEVKKYVEEAMRERVVLQMRFDQLSEKLREIEVIQSQNPAGLDEKIENIKAQSQKENQLVTQELEWQRKETTALQQELEAMKADYAKVANDYATAQAENIRLTSELESRGSGHLVENFESPSASHVTSIPVEETDQYLSLKRSLVELQQELLEEKQKSESYLLEKGYMESELASARRELELSEAELEARPQPGSYNIENDPSYLTLNHANQELIAQIQEMTDQNHELRHSNQELQDSLRNLQVKNEEFTDMIHGLTNERDRLNEQLSNSHNHDSSNNDQASKFQELFNEFEGYKYQAQSENSNLLSQLEEERAKFAQETANYGPVHSELESVKAHNSQLQAEIQQIQYEMNLANQSLETAMQEVTELKSKTISEQKVRSNLVETQNVLDSLRSSAERERQLIIEAAQMHAEEIIGRAQRRLSEENWELRRAQIERQRFLDGFKALVTKYANDLEKTSQSLHEDGEGSNGISNDENENSNWQNRIPYSEIEGGKSDDHYTGPAFDVIQGHNAS